MGVVAAIGVGLSAGSAAAGGVQARRAADYENKQYQQAAGQAVAASQRTAEEEQHKSRLLQSRALAVAAASGGGASDPDVTKIISNIAGEGAYRSAVALFDGEEKARVLSMKGDAVAREGRSKQTAGMISAVSTIATSGTSMYAKYGQGGYSSLGYGSADPTLASEGLPY